MGGQITNVNTKILKSKMYLNTVSYAKKIYFCFFKIEIRNEILSNISF